MADARTKTRYHNHPHKQSFLPQGSVDPPPKPQPHLTPLCSKDWTNTLWSDSLPAQRQKSREGVWAFSPVHSHTECPQQLKREPSIPWAKPGAQGKLVLSVSISVHSCELTSTRQHLESTMGPVTTATKQEKQTPMSQ